MKTRELDNTVSPRNHQNESFDVTEICFPDRRGYHWARNLGLVNQPKPFGSPNLNLHLFSSLIWTEAFPGTVTLSGFFHSRMSQRLAVLKVTSSAFNHTRFSTYIMKQRHGRQGGFQRQLKQWCDNGLESRCACTSFPHTMSIIAHCKNSTHFLSFSVTSI